MSFKTLKKCLTGAGSTLNFFVGHYWLRIKNTGNWHFKQCWMSIWF